MKKVLLFGAAICCIFAISSCKSKSSAYKTAYEQAKATDENWDEEEDDKEVLTSEEISYASVTQEKVSPVKGEDVSGLRKYSVVIGSFKNSTNAFSLKDRMIDEGYRPVIAENDYGMLRVIVTSFESKADAVRSRDAIKAKYAPNFQDAWILERKY
jgi:cell division protein FtsN